MLGIDANAAATYRRLLRHLRPYRLIVIAVVVPAALYALISTLVPLLMGEFVSQLQDAARNSAKAWQFPLLIAVAFRLRAGAARVACRATAGRHPDVSAHTRD